MRAPKLPACPNCGSFILPWSPEIRHDRLTLVRRCMKCDREIVDKLSAYTEWYPDDDDPPMQDGHIGEEE